MANPIEVSEKVYWVVVADEAQALIYSRATRTGPLTLIDTLTNEAGRKKRAELVTDRGGRSFDRVGKGRHAIRNERSGPKVHAAEVFAKDIASRIADVMHDGSCRGYALVAAPRFLGMLRHALSTTTRTEPFMTVDKELVGHSEADIKRLVDGK